MTVILVACTTVKRNKVTICINDKKYQQKEGEREREREREREIKKKQTSQHASLWPQMHK